MRELDPRYVLPSRKSVSKKHIVDTYNRTKNDIRNSLAKSRTHAVTTDMWTSSSNTSYMGVTAHWIDDQFVQHNRCLEVKPAPGSHTADFLSSELTAVMDEWNIDPKHVHIVTDSGANIRKAVTQMPDVKWRGCFAHKLQLCVNGALTSQDLGESARRCGPLPPQSACHHAAEQSAGPAQSTASQTTAGLPNKMEFAGS